MNLVVRQVEKIYFIGLDKLLKTLKYHKTILQYILMILTN